MNEQILQSLQDIRNCLNDLVNILLFSLELKLCGDSIDKDSIEYNQYLTNYINYLISRMRP